MTKPLLLIDVDGVLNVLGRGDPLLMLEEHKAMRFTIRTTRTFGEWLTGLQDVFELVWATTWVDDANTFISPIVGLPTLPVVPLDAKRDWNSHEYGTSWKLAGVREYVGDRAFAWIDDDIWQDVFDWAAARGVPSLPVRIDPMRGLDEIVVRQLRQWAEGLLRIDLPVDRDLTMAADLPGSY